MERPPAVAAGRGEHASHLVHFFENDDVMCMTIARFVAAGLASGEAVLVIATDAHARGIRQRLADGCIDVARAEEVDRLLFLDANRTLEELSIDGKIDERRFHDVIGTAVDRAARAGDGNVRAHGEIVDILAARHELEQALTLERWWNDLIAKRSIALLCSYSESNVAHPDEASSIEALHDSADQRARALEIEIERRRVLEISLREREAELRDLLENAADGIHFVAADGTIVWANRAELELLGYRAEEYIGRKITEFHADDDVIRAILDRLTCGETLHGVEARLRAKDGSIRHVLISSNVLRRNGAFIHTRCFTHDITARRLAENELRATAQRLEAVLAQMPSAVAIVEAPSGRLLLANEQNARVFRQPNVALAGVEDYGRFRGLHPDGREIAPHEWPLSRSIATGEVVRGEVIHVVRGDGSDGYIRTTSSPIRDAEGTIVAGVVTYDDVTTEIEQRRATETLLRVSTMLSSELDLDTLMQKLTDEATALCRAEFGSFFYNVVDASGESYMLYTLSGVPREAFAKFPMPRNTAIFAPTFTGEAVVRIADVKKDPRYGKNPPYNGMPEGHLPVTSYLAVPVKTRDGAVLGGLFFGHSREDVFSDQDERLLVAIAAHAGVAIENARSYRAAVDAERTAELERSRLRDLFMHVPARIWILRGPDHVVEFVNRTARDALGELEGVGKPLRELLRDGDPKDLAVLDEVYRTGRRRSLAAVRVLGDRYFDVTYEAIRDGNGAVEGVMAFSNDVTDQVIARRRIEGIVRELEVANRMKDDFLATVSHELRTPLNAILGWTRMLRGGELQAETREKALATIQRNAEAQTQLIEDLLDVSRIISCKMRLELSPVDLAQVVAGALDAVRPAALAKNVQITHVGDAATTPILGDADRLQQVVWNLLSNAVKFTPRDGHVQVALRRREAFVDIVVSDDGQGIEHAFLPYVFERFRQADPTTTRKTMGLGLGLAIVRHLVELHGGIVHVDSEGAGKGATFTVTLPISSARTSTSAELPPVHRSAKTSQLASPPELARARVLVVEDDDDARDLLGELLGECCARVSTAGDAATALALVESERPDVIVSDIGLPGEDGYAFIAKVRALPVERGGRTPAVALTAYTRVEDRTKALVAGFNMHVPKPVEPTELLTVLASLSALFPARD